MSAVREYEHGMPCWVDLATTDVTIARDFYSEVFGWGWDAQEADGEGEWGTYYVAEVNGQSVAGLAQQPSEDSGRPPTWNLYVSVASLAEAVAEVTAAGGTVVMPEMEIAGAGRMAGLVDPVGAALFLWQGEDMTGAQLQGAPGSLVWSELLCSDCPAAMEFYGSLFGWLAEKRPADGADAYVISSQEGAPVAGARDPKSGIPARWLAYFGCDDAAEVAARVGSNGGALAIEPVETAHGRMGVAVDALGAAFAFSEMAGG